MNIGYANPGYPVVRTILNKCNGVNYTRVRPFSSILSGVASKLHKNRVASDLVFTYFGGMNARGVDLYHFFNTIPLTNIRKPFITTFETTVPRFFSKGCMYQNALKSIASDRCKKLLALSECTKTLQTNLFNEAGVDHLADKIEVLHPPQDLLTSLEDVKAKADPRTEIVFIFVGRAFYHKGGSHCVHVLNRLREHFPILLQIVGDIRSKDYMDNPSRDNANEIFKIIDKNQSWIEYYPSLPNSQVLEMIRHADVGLLPTRGDTYGYSVLEMQAAGLPCITTDLRALPEINNETCGWLIQIPKDKSCNAAYASQEEKDFLCDTIERQLEDICISILEHPEILKAKSINAFKRIVSVHDPIRYGEILHKLYQDAIS